MTGERRQLAAIFAADVAGYSRLMGADEEGTIAALRGHRQAVIEPKLEEFHGRIANTAGDTFLIEFPSAVDALHCGRTANGSVGGYCLRRPIAALIQAGRMDEARAEAQGLLVKFAKYTAEQATRSHVYKEAEDMKQFVVALREAGLPE
jgi:class 3 adenylate cyclase